MLRDICLELASAVDTIEWSADHVSKCVRAVSAALAARPSHDELDAALAVLVARLDRASVDDADGVAHAAITGGSLVENGARPEQLGRVLVSKLPSVLGAARRFADVCLRVEPVLAGDEPEPDGIMARVDRRAISRATFFAHVASDRPGASALVQLTQWTLPLVACLTRDRTLLASATQDTALIAAARAMKDSNAHWLHVLLGVQLDVRAVVVHVPSRRGFRMTLDGLASNFELRALVEDALLERGLPGRRNPLDVLAVVRGERERASQTVVSGVYNLYTYRAASFDLTVPGKVPAEHTIWNEGAPNDIPMLDDHRVILVGPPQYKRNWNVGRPFSALHARVDVVGELAADELDRWLRRCVEPA